MGEITRKLVTVQKVAALDPIEGADRIEVASVLGWKMVAQKGLYHVGDLVAFFEIDSFLPIWPQFEFLRKSSYRVTKDLGEGYRIKTVKLRGQISQGLLMPLVDFPDLFAWDELANEGMWESLTEATGGEMVTSEIPDGLQIDVAASTQTFLEEGDDLTALFGVRKYEPNQSVLLSGVAVGSFPSFVPKTDEPRVQNLTRERNYWAEDDFAVTIKEDGSSMTVFVEFDPENMDTWRVGVASRNWEVKDEDGNSYWKVAKEIGLVAGLEQSGLGVAVQGELVGPGVQSNPGGYDKLRFKIFNIWMIEEKKYLNTDERHEWVTAFNLLFKAELEEVKDVGFVRGVLSDQSDLDYMITLAGQDVEGVVFKSIQHPERSYKYINPNYLLKDKD